jgi:hypothetical protein
MATMDQLTAAQLARRLHLALRRGDHVAIINLQNRLQARLEVIRNEALKG